MENKTSFQAVILAAGESSRFWPLNSGHKSLIKIMDKPLIWYTIDGLRKAGVGDIIIIQGKNRDVEDALRYFNLDGVQYAVQEEPKGMGEAIMVARPLINGQFLVLNAHSVDCREVVSKMVEKSRQTGAKMVLVGQPTKDPWLYGVARFEDDKLFEVVEKPAQGSEPSNIKINGTYLLDNKIFEYFDKILGTTHHNQEFEVSMSAYAKDNDSRIVVLADDYKGVSLKYPWHLFKAQKYLFGKFLTKKNISKSAQVAKSAIIEGDVVIGQNCKIYEGAVIKGPCYIGDNSIVGNNSVVRDCNLEAGAIVGALCEIGRTIFQPDVHVHSGYFGDSIMSSGVRVGAGSITANIRIDRGPISARVKKEKGGIKVLSKVDTGLTSLGVIIGRNTKIGTRATFMPARFVGKDCFIGPMAVVTKNIDDGTTVE